MTTTAPAPFAFPVFTTKKARLEWFKSKFRQEVAWAFRCIDIIYDYQTSTEKAALETRDHNDVGFSGIDAEICSSFVQRVRTVREKCGEPCQAAAKILSVKQQAVLIRIAPKYAGQIIKHLESSGKAPAIMKGQTK